MAFSEVLYYPWIDIRDEGWLKTATLYWDSVRTIVPESIAHPYSSNTAEALQNIGFLIPLRVHSEMPEINELSDDVLTYLDSPQGAELFFANRTGTGQLIHADKLPNELRRLSKVHPEKLSHEIRHRLRELDIASVAHGDWLEVDDRFASFYMTLLATRLSERIGVGLLTPSSTYDRLAVTAKLDAPLSNILQRRWGHREYDAWGPRRRAPNAIAQGMLADLALQKIAIPPDTPIERLADFRRNHIDEIGAFRRAIGQLTASIPTDVPMEHMQQTIFDLYRNEVGPAISNLKKALRESRIRSLAEGILKITFISVGSASILASIGLSTPSALLAGAGVSLTVTGILHNVGKSDALRNNPYSYVLAIEREFG